MCECGEAADQPDGRCFFCRYWQVRVDQRERFTIIGGVCYVIGPEQGDRYSKGPSVRGHGGVRFKVRLLSDGSVVETTNLWCNGVVPERFRSVLPDTAVFV